MVERIWEPYLTNQDRAHLSKSEYRAVGFGGPLTADHRGGRFAPVGPAGQISAIEFTHH